MLNYDKEFIKDQITLEDQFDLLSEWGANPIYVSSGIIAETICHNPPNEGSRKLYFYTNSNMYYCYSGCEEPSFDIFELTRKVFRIQKEKEITFNDAVRWVAQKLNIISEIDDIAEDDILSDWKYLDNYSRIQEIEIYTNNIVLKEYDSSILDRFNYTVNLGIWTSEGITKDVLTAARIGYYPGQEQITIPHFDINNRFIGLRGRGLVQEDIDRYGKYHPLMVNNQLYNHPLSMNLYNLNNSKDNIKIMQKAIVFESEKSALKYQSFFGRENDISVAVCGSALSDYQVNLLIQNGAKEIVLAYDRDFEDIGDDKFKRLKKKVINLSKKYGNNVVISIIWDKDRILGLKDSPIDDGPDKFLTLFKNRVII